MSPPAETTGSPGAGCAACGSPLATDQTYCVECGTRRGRLPARIGIVLDEIAGGRPLPSTGTEFAAAGANAEPAPEGYRPGRLAMLRTATIALLATLAFGVVIGGATASAGLGGLSHTLLSSLQPAVGQVASAVTGPVSGGSGASGGGGAGAGSGGGGGGASAQASAPPTRATVTVGGGGGGGGGGEGGGGDTGTGGTTSSTPQSLPPIRHVFEIVLSDQGYEQSFEDPSVNPYLAKTLVAQGEIVPNYDAVAGSALANEVALLSGQGPTPQTVANCPTYDDIAPGTTGAQQQALGGGCIYPAATQTLAEQLTNDGLDWKAYIQGIGGSGPPTSTTTSTTPTTTGPAPTTTATAPAPTTTATTPTPTPTTSAPAPPAPTPTTTTTTTVVAPPTTSDSGTNAHTDPGTGTNAPTAPGTGGGTGTNSHTAPETGGGAGTGTDTHQTETTAAAVARLLSFAHSLAHAAARGHAVRRRHAVSPPPPLTDTIGAKACPHPASGAPNLSLNVSSTSTYVTTANPFVFFRSVLDSGQCDTADVDLSELARDLKSASTTPAFSYISPDPCDNGSDQPCTPGAPAGLAQADAFLEQVVPEIERSPAYRQDGLILITFNEAPQYGPHWDTSSCCGQPATYPNLPATATTTTGAGTTTGSGSATTTTTTTTAGTTTTTGTGTTGTGTTGTGTTGCPPTTSTSTSTTATTPASTSTGTGTGTTATGTGTGTTTTCGPAITGDPPGGGQVGLLLISPYVKPGTTDLVDSLNHFSLLKGIEDLLGVGHLGYAASASVPSLGPSMFLAAKR